VNRNTITLNTIKLMWFDLTRMIRFVRSGIGRSKYEFCEILNRTMKKIKKIGHWAVFVVGGSIGTWLILGIATLLPLFVGLWLFTLGDFWFFLIGSFLLAIYYILVFMGISSFFTFLNKNKPDYWVSNIILVLTTVYFFYNLINKLGRNVSQDIELFMNFKGIVLLITILPAYLKILFYSLIVPFVKVNHN
jgi:hypothetical protein